MKEYLGDHELTHRAHWPAGSLDQAQPLYRTGDYAIQYSHVVYWFTGRRDGILKLRGYRIAIEEVQAVLSLLPGAREAAVVPTSDGRGGLSLNAIIVPHPGADVSTLTVKSHCGRHLPPYMVPHRVSITDSLPRTSTGKIDFQRLR